MRHLRPLMLALVLVTAGAAAVPLPASAAGLTLTVSPLWGVVSAPVTATATMPSPCGQLPPGAGLTFRFTWDLTFVTFGTASTVCTSSPTIRASFKGLPPAAHNAQGAHTLGVFVMDGAGSPLGSAFAAYVISPPRPPRPSPTPPKPQPLAAYAGQASTTVSAPSATATPPSSGECVRLAAAVLPHSPQTGDIALIVLAVTAAVLAVWRRRRLRHLLAVLLVVVAVTSCSGASVAAPPPSPSTPACFQ